MRRTLLVTVAVAAGMLAGCIGPSGRASTTVHADPTIDSVLFSLVNSDRTSNGLAALKWSQPLGNIAEGGEYTGCGFTVYGRADDMIARNYFAHPILGCDGQYVFSMMTAAGVHYESAGENIGWNDYTDPAEAAAQINTAFMNSPEHRANILNPAYTHVGIGSASSGANTWSGGGATGYQNVSMFTEEFAQLPAGTPGNSPPAPAVTVAQAAANQNFVALAYTTVLGRTADAGGLAYWTHAINGGAARDGVALTLLSSAEYRTDLINNDYQLVFGRGVDPAGLAFWLGYMRGGNSDERVLANLISSPEFFADAGNSNATFVGNLYSHLLGRPADPDGLAFWTEQLNNGSPRATAVVRLLSSAEYESNLLQGMYWRYLDRAGDPGGVTYALGLLARGASDEDVAVNLIASGEYFNRAQQS